jgi:hypothetical protein
LTKVRFQFVKRYLIMMIFSEEKGFGDEVCLK